MNAPAAARPTTSTFALRVRARHAFRFLAAVLLVGALSVVALELLLVITDPWLFKGAFVYDPVLGARGRPYYGDANRFGFNDVDRPLQKPPGVLRLLVLGDSFNWFGGREGNYSALLERKFEQHYGAHVVDVVNVGISGTHSGEQLALLKRFGLEFQPDIVLLGFFAGNDFIDADPYRRRIALNGVLINLDTRWDAELVVRGRPLVTRSRLWSLLQDRWELFRERRRPHASLRPGSMSDERFFAIKASYLTFCDPRRQEQGFFAGHIDYIFRSIDAMGSLLRNRGVPLIVAIYPEEISVSELVAQEVFSRLHVDAHRYDLACPQHLLRDHLELVGIPFVDLLEDFRRQQKETDLYLVRDGHWNAAGNRLAADVLFARLTDTIDQLRLARGMSGKQ